MALEALEALDGMLLLGSFYYPLVLGGNPRSLTKGKTP